MANGNGGFMQGLGELGANPLFGIGMGLLRHRRDATVDPYQAMQEGLLAAAQERRTMEEQKRDEQAREALMQFMQQTGGQMPPGMGQLPPDINAPQMSMIGQQPQMSYTPQGQRLGVTEDLSAQNMAQQIGAQGTPPSMQTPQFKYETPDLARFYGDEYWKMILGNQAR